MCVEVRVRVRVVLYVYVFAFVFCVFVFALFLRGFKKENFRALSLLEQKKENRTNRQREVVFFLSSAFTATSFVLPGCIRAVFSTSFARAVPSQRARVEGTGRG